MGSHVLPLHGCFPSTMQHIKGIQCMWVDMCASFSCVTLHFHYNTYNIMDLCQFMWLTCFQIITFQCLYWNPPVSWSYVIGSNIICTIENKFKIIISYLLALGFNPQLDLEGPISLQAYVFVIIIILLHHDFCYDFIWFRSADFKII